MNLPPIPAANFVLGSFFLTAYIPYQSRLNGLETSRQRERHLTSRLEEVTHIEDIWGVTVDTVRFHENRGFWYRKRKFVTGGLSGETTVVVRYDNATIPGDFWDTDGAQAFLDGFEFDVEHLNTSERLDPTVARFKIGAIEPESIEAVFVSLIEMEERFR